MRSKGTVYQGGVRVPLIVTGPTVGSPARTEPGLVHAVDLFHTIAELQSVDARTAVPQSVALDGVSFTSLLQAAGQPGVRQHVYSQKFSSTTAMTVPGDAEVIRDARHELLRFQMQAGVREELYDLDTDPWETTNLLLQPLAPAAEAAYRDLSTELARLRGIARAIPFGNGCGGSGAQPVLHAMTQPTLGTIFRMRVSGLTAAVGSTFGAIGFDDELWLGNTLPWDLTPLGMTGCELLVAPTITKLLPATSPILAWNEPLPNNSALLGLGLYMQAFVALTGANPANALATRALEAVVGS